MAIQGGQVENQRNLDQTSYAWSLAAKEEMARTLEIIQDVLMADPTARQALDESQIAFESYRSSQLKLISAVNTGTSAPLIRNAEDLRLCAQRTELLRAFLIDNAPDRVL